MDERALELLFASKETNYKIAQETGITAATLGNYRNGITKPTRVNALALIQYFTNPLPPALENGSSGRLIPFYDNVTSIGGTQSVANTEGVSQPSEYIDTGDWFREATAAIRHYGESMVEYPEGCILALKEVNERQLIVWGRDYVIETSEYRITKRVQRGQGEEWIKAYSTNTSTYPDGQLIHEPLNIPWSEIRHISLVLGYVVKKNGGTMVFNSNHKK